MAENEIATQIHRLFGLDVPPSLRGKILILLVFFVGCAKQQESVKLFPIKGEVVEVQHERRRIVISHGEISGLMDAMTMPFKVKDITLLNLVQVGDSVEGTLAVSDSGIWIHELSVTVKAKHSSELSSVEPAQLFAIGSPVPDIPFTNQDGKKVTFSGFRGKVVALTFIYTRCPDPDFCIKMSDHFSKVQKLLEREPSLRGKWHLLSISFDPANDKPAVLKEYSRAYTVDLSSWDCLVGTDKTTSILANGLDLFIERGASGLIKHTLRTAILDQDGNLVKLIKGNDWSPSELAQDIRDLIRKHSS